MDAADSCATCGTPMASDQRYCLGCGTRRAHVGSALLDRLRAGSPPSRSATAPADASGQVDLAQPITAGEPAATVPARSGGPTAVIAGVGVLLLSMGIGVLIGRSGSGTGRAAPAQVISVASPGAGAATTATTPPTRTSTPSKSSLSHKAGASSTSTPAGVGSSPSKPAPPTVLNNLRTGGSGQSYEQKSKNLPNVVSTG
jgi:hypothetical protein